MAGRTTSLLALAVATLLAGEVTGQVIVVVNNGLAPPDPENVIDASDGPIDVVSTQNVGCNYLLENPCVAPGAATFVSITPTADVGVARVSESSALLLDGSADFLFVSDAATVTILAGNVLTHTIVADTSFVDASGGVFSGSGGPGVFAHDNARFDASGATIHRLLTTHFAAANLHLSTVHGLTEATGNSHIRLHDARLESVLASQRTTIAGSAIVADAHSITARDDALIDFDQLEHATNAIDAFDRATIVIAGGTVQSALHARDDATIVLVGSDFEIDGVPVDFGPLPAAGNLVKGELHDGGTIASPYCASGRQGCPSDPDLDKTGTILVVPSPDGRAAIVTAWLALCALARQRH